jgi:predicted secreted protein
MVLLGVLVTADAQPVECGTPVDPNQQVQVALGQTFAVALPSQPGTGYSWSISMEPDPNVVDPVTSANAENPRPGAPEKQCFVFSAAGVGETTLQFQYSRPFDPSTTPPAQTQGMHVTVVPSGGSVPVQLPPTQ